MQPHGGAREIARLCHGNERADIAEIQVHDFQPLQIVIAAIKSFQLFYRRLETTLG
jgi:hypothetical protein